MDFRALFFKPLKPKTMKAEITTKEKAFEPIEVKITIESLEELAELCARLSISIKDINYCSLCKYSNIETNSTVNGTWKLLDNLYLEIIK